MSTTPPSAFRRVLPYLGFFAILLLFSVIYYADTITLLPFGIHEWAQGDRMALALNFYDNGLNFFKPATQNLDSINGIVGVEFPIQSYLAGALGYVFGRGSISICFRIVDILIAWTGLFFLFRIVYDRTKDFILSIVAPLLIFCSPIYVVYSGNFMPDPAAVSVVFISFYFFLQYADTHRFRKLVVSMLLLTLAVLIKASTATYWLGVLGFGFYVELLVRKNRRHALMLAGVAALSIGVVLLQMLYINYLNTTYHSTLFLSKIRPFTDLDDVHEYIGFPFKNTWMKEYFLLAQYPIIALILAIGINILKKTAALKHYLWPVAIFLPGAIVMFCLFGHQLKVHDYYILAIFFPLVAYMLVVSMIAIHKRFGLFSLKEVRIGFFTALVFIFFFADHQVYNRLHCILDYDENYSSIWLRDGASVADSVGIPRNERILIAGDSPPNLGLVYFDRKGYTLPPESFKEHIGYATQFMNKINVRYLIIRDTTFTKAILKERDALTPYEVLRVTRGKAILKLK